MRDLAAYSYANARIRALLSYLISPPLLSRLLEAKDVYEVIEGLKGTDYKSIQEQFEQGRTDLSDIEKGFFIHDLGAYDKVYDSLSGKREKELVFLFIQRYELQELKAVLRIWNKKAPVDTRDYLVGRKIAFDIDFHKISAAQNIEELILLLDETPYKTPLLKAKDRFKRTGSVFYLETALDIDYYRRLLACVDTLSGGDRRIARKVLGIEIDIENINWLVRAKKYYSLATGEILEMIIPGGGTISADTVRQLSGSEGLEGLLDNIAVGPYMKIKDFAAGNAALLENFLYEIMLREIRRLLAGFPFTIGTVLGYLILKNRETRILTSLLYAKHYGLKKEEALPLIGTS
ncbi:MAG: V-type ATPase subunit [Candidatus Omnitrophica bacterium]|nr:V-type ATPase subunit [Candidatus Omnitrophota bacterium]